MTWVLYMWLASAPSVLQPVDRFEAKAQCLTARREEVQRNMSVGLGGGVTYICLQDKE